jgi:hypothetical protein
MSLPNGPVTLILVCLFGAARGRGGDRPPARSVVLVTAARTSRSNEERHSCYVQHDAVADAKPAEKFGWTRTQCRRLPWSTFQTRHRPTHRGIRERVKSRLGALGEDGLAQLPSVSRGEISAYLLNREDNNMGESVTPRPAGWQHDEPGRCEFRHGGWSRVDERVV